MTTDPRTFTMSPVASAASVEIHQLKRGYERHLIRAKGLDSKTVEHRLSAIDKLAKFLGANSIKTFSAVVAIKYVDHALQLKNARTGTQRALTTVTAELNRVKDFLIWLHSQSGYKSRIRHDDIQYLTVNRKELRAARHAVRKSQPSIVDCRLAFERLPRRTDVQRRDRALFALLMLTGGRIKALVAMQLRHVNIDGGYILQSGVEGCTKDSKTFISAFLHVDKIYKKELKAWIKFLKKEKKFRDEDPLFPRPVTSKAFSSGPWSVLSRDFYKGSGRLSSMISGSFLSSTGTRHGPHSLRRTITIWVAENSQRQDEWKAASLNLGHSDVRTTGISYLSLTEEQQIKLVHGIGRKQKTQK